MLERASSASSTFEEEVEESIEFEEEDQSPFQRDAVHSVSRTSLRNPATHRAPRVQAENVRRRHPPAPMGGSASGGTSSRGAPPRLCACMPSSASSAGIQPILSPGRHGVLPERELRVKGVNPSRGVHDKMETQHTERQRQPVLPERELRVKGVNPSRGLAKLPDSPIHFKHMLPLSCSERPDSDGEDGSRMPTRPGTE